MKLVIILAIMVIQQKNWQFNLKRNDFCIKISVSSLSVKQTQTFDDASCIHSNFASNSNQFLECLHTSSNYKLFQSP